jgi:hypothetical protein
MISIEDRKLFERAEAKARQIKPRVTVVAFGEYRVAGSKGTEYTVRFSKSTTGHWVASCTCPAHVGPDNLTPEQREGYKAKACYHIVAGHAAHKVEVFKRQQFREDLLCCHRCGGKFFAHFEGKPWCGECLKAEEARRELLCKDCGAPATGSEGRCEECDLQHASACLFG